MPFDYKKEYKEYYMPKNKPSIINIPKMNYIAVRGKGNPNDEIGEYKESIGLLYAISDELHQSFIPERSPQIIDVIIDLEGNLFGILLVLLIILGVRKARKKGD